MKENNKRFIQTHAQQDGLANRTYVLIDRETGVNYRSQDSWRPLVSAARA